MVQDVHGRDFEAYRETLPDPKRLEDATVPNREARPDNNARSRRTEPAGRRRPERCWIEPLICAALAGWQIRIGKDVRTDRDGSRRAIRSVRGAGRIRPRPKRREKTARVICVDQRR